MDHWDDFFEIGDRPEAPGGGPVLLPAMSRHPSVLELERALRALRLRARKKYAHLCGYYSADSRLTRAPKVVRNKRGRRVAIRANPADPRDWTSSRERVVLSWVRHQEVRDAIALLAQEPRVAAGDSQEQAKAKRDAFALARPWAFRGPVFLPDELLESAA